MLKKLSKAFKIFKAAKEIKDVFKEPKTNTEELVDRPVSNPDENALSKALNKQSPTWDLIKKYAKEQPEPYNAEDEIHEAVKDFYKPSEKQQKEASELGVKMVDPSIYLEYKYGAKSTNFTQDQKDGITYAVKLLEDRNSNPKIKFQYRENGKEVLEPTYAEKLPEILPAAIKEAKWAASLSPCQKAKVGATIFSDDKILAIGFNTNTTAVACDSVQCQVAGKNNSTNCGILHAEVVAIQNLLDSEFYGWQKYIYCTQFPCTACLHQIIEQDIYQVFYGQENYFTADLIRLFPEVTFTQA